MSHLRFCALLLLCACSPAQLQPDADELGRFATREDYLQRLEPRGDRILHGAGLSPSPFASYWDQMDRTPPLLYAIYYDLGGLRPHWPLILQDILAQYSRFILPQIDLGLSFNNRPYDRETAEGALDEQIDMFCFGLGELRQPVFVRFAYQANNPWAGYQPETYRQAWTRFNQVLRGRWQLPHVATVWSCSAGGQDDFMEYYPGDEQVDWWALDVSDPAHFRSPLTRTFMREARARGFPVLVGVATPIGLNLDRGEAVWQEWFAPLFRFLRAHPHIKAFTYMSWDWERMRNEADPLILERYEQELRNPVYLHATPVDQLRWILEWDN